MLPMESKDTAGVAFLPPLSCRLGFGLGFLASLVPALLVPFALPLPLWVRGSLGIALVTAGPLLTRGAFLAMRAAQTPVNP